MENIFYEFCDSTKKGSKVATSKTIKKICTDCKIFNKNFNANMADIALTKFMGNAKKEMNFQEFNHFIEGELSDEYYKANKISKQEAVDRIKSKFLEGASKSHGATKVSGDAATSRLTDVKGYTGAHKERFDADTGKGKGIEGREYRMDEKAASGYVGGYKGKDTYDKSK